MLNANSFSYIACKRLHHASFKLNIVNFWRAFSFGPLNPLRGLKCTQTPNCILFSNSCRTQIFFSFLVNTLNTDCMWCFMQLGTILQVLECGNHPWRSATLSKVIGFRVCNSLKVSFLHGCFSFFKNCVNGTKSC